jgi:hypothetical protein
MRTLSRHWRLAALLVVLASAAGWFGWRWFGQTVDVVIVNASGLPAQFSWQPQPFAEETTVAIGGCESKSMVLRAGEHWHIEHGRYEGTSNFVDVPLTAQLVAVEIWLDPDQSVRMIQAHPVDQPIDAPVPVGCATS